MFRSVKLQRFFYRTRIIYDVFVIIIILYATIIINAGRSRRNRAKSFTETKTLLLITRRVQITHIDDASVTITIIVQ